MSICPKCNGRKYIELDKVGLLVTGCPDCKGTGEIDDSGIRELVDFSGGTDTSQPKQLRKKRKKVSRKAK